MWRLSLQFFSWSDTAFLALTNVVVLSSIIRVFKSTPSSFRDFWHFIVRATGRSFAICAVAFPCGYGIGNTALSTCYMYIEKDANPYFYSPVHKIRLNDYLQKIHSLNPSASNFYSTTCLPSSQLCSMQVVAGTWSSSVVFSFPGLFFPTKLYRLASFS